MANIPEIAVEVPNGYWGDLGIKLYNNHFDDDVPVDICGMDLITIGENMPCFNRQSDLNIGYYETLDDWKTVERGSFGRSSSLFFEGICYIPLDHKQSARTIKIEAAVRLPSDIEDVMLDKSLSKLNLTVMAVPVTEQLASAFTFSFNVDSPSPGSVRTDPIEAHEVDITSDPSRKNAVVTGGQVWLDYTVTFPPQKTAPFRMSVLTPSDNGRAVATITDMAFGDDWSNCLCVGSEVHLPSSYGVTYQQSDNLNTFMQKDYGSTAANYTEYITNSGWTIKQGNHDSPKDDQFTVRAKVQMTDHPWTSHDRQFEVYLAMQFGDIIVVSSSLVTAIRPQTGAYSHNITDIYGNFTSDYLYTWER